MNADDANTYERLHAWAEARQTDEWAREFEVRFGTAWSVTLRVRATPYTIDGAGHGYAPDLPTAANEALEMIEAERNK